MYEIGKFFAFGDRKNGMWKSYRGDAKMQFLFLVHSLGGPRLCIKIKCSQKSLCTIFAAKKSRAAGTLEN